MEFKVANWVRENIRDLRPFSSARAEYSGDADILLDANENPFDNGLNRYPDPYQKDLKARIAEWKNIGHDYIFLGNGSDEIIDILTRTFCEPRKDIIRYIYPTFGMYEVISDINDVRKEPVMLGEGFDLDTERCLQGQSDRHKLLFLCSPNNPTGNTLARERVLEVIRRFHGVVVLDEAYIEFSSDPSYLEVLKRFPNLVILQTFSKALGAAGLRLGMGFADPGIISFMNKVKPPYNVGSEVQNQAMRIIDNWPELSAEKIEVIKKERDRMAEKLAGIPAVRAVYPSQANFLLVKFDDAQAVFQFLKDREIIVRDRSRLPGCEGCLRITVGMPEENSLLIHELNELSA